MYNLLILIYKNIFSIIEEPKEKQPTTLEKSCQTMITGEILSLNFYQDKNAENREMIINVPFKQRIPSKLLTFKDLENDNQVKV